MCGFHLQTEIVCLQQKPILFVQMQKENVLDPPQSEFQELGDIYSKELSECKTSCDDFEMEPLFRLVTKM